MTRIRRPISPDCARDRRCCATAASGLLLAFVLADDARAQDCNSDANPTPPNVTIPNPDGQTFGPSPKPGLVIDLRGEPGCQGAEADNQGGPGGPGQPAASAASIDFENVTTVGDSGYFAAVGGASLPIVASGGAGGDGGQSDYGGSSGTGGNGGAGGAAGMVTGKITNYTVTPVEGAELLGFGLYVGANGGTGGTGGDASHDLYTIVGGYGGVGAAGGRVTLDLDAHIGAAQTSADFDTAAALFANGGGGGPGGYGQANLSSTYGGPGSAGGVGGSVAITTSSASVFASSQFGILLSAIGGDGGTGGSSGSNTQTSNGGAGAAAGNGGTASLTFDGSVVVTGDTPGPEGFWLTGLQVSANGGSGGDGGLAANALGGGGGSGGRGGDGGVASLTLLGNVTVTGYDGPDVPGGYGVLVQANGGQGGQGSLTSTQYGHGGNGGVAGNGATAQNPVQLTLGSATAASAARVTTNGIGVEAIVAQSIGGGGGGGGSASNFASGAAGANGGDGGVVHVDAMQVWSIANGEFSHGLVAQSIGGGGGIGGTTTDAVVLSGYVIGGNGGNGGDGGALMLDLGGSNNIFASTSTYAGGGVLAQSIGGSGGVGGNASAKGFGFFVLTVGGAAGPGGTASTVDINSGGLVTTYGDHASGLQAQSIGGGGGVGGAAVSLEVGTVLPTVAASVGGSGGTGGTASAVTIENDGQVMTYGTDAHGINAQSIGGGGGTGGSAVATAVDLALLKDVPAVSVSYATGGSGGSGNTGGDVTVTNTGYVITANHGSYGVKAQSVGGGGGDAGDASAASWTATPGDSELSVNLSTAIGGVGGIGGKAGDVDTDNSGLVYTVGQDSHAVFAQSVGGGGGTGGTGDTSANAVNDDVSFSIAYGVGGTGGTGGDGGTVSLINRAAAVIATRGDGSDAVFAQSVGGGGGQAGGGVASSSGGSVSLALAVGGKGGAGGTGGAVTLSNDGIITTMGTDAMGLTAQSVGGGGGRGGKAGATAGGADDNLPELVTDQILDAFNTPDAESTNVVGNLYLLSDRLKGDYTTASKLADHFTGQAPKPGEDDSLSLTVAASLAIGGQGGAAGSGGTITLTNTGDILTQGAQADGIVGQSVGGGGGIAGFSAASGTATDDASANLELSAGGVGGGGGDGGGVTVTNTRTVTTMGVSAYGIVAQSAGGGGGRGGASADSSTGALSFGVSLGGGGGNSGNGGAVEIDLACTMSGSACEIGTGSVDTSGKHAVGLVAQSVGGGGGLLRTMRTDQQGDQSDADDNDDADVHNIFLDLGVNGSGGTQGHGGTATVMLGVGTEVRTIGRNAHGVVANSIGGGGGGVGGGVINLINWNDSANNAGGDGGGTTIALTNASVAVTGSNSVGLWASSMGGGGSLILTDAKDDAVSSAPPSGQSGNGGDVTVTLGQGSVVTTQGGGHGIIAQSIGGGGISYWDGGGAGPKRDWVSLYPEMSYYGDGTAGDVAVNLTGGSAVTVGGANASGIVAAAAESVNSDTSTATATISIDKDSHVTSGSATRATVMLMSVAATNQLNNAGTIRNTVPGGYAVSDGGFRGGVAIHNSGTITGNIDVYTPPAATVAAPPRAASSIRNAAGGVLAPYDTIDLGAGGRIENAGGVEVGGVGRIHATTLSGDLVQTGTGRLHFDLDSVAGEVDHLHVTGAAALDGGFAFVPVTLLPGAHEVLSTEVGVTLAENLPRTGTHVFAFTPRATATALSLETEADFLAEGADTTDRRSIGGHLQRMWDAGGGDFGTGFAALAGVGDAGSYRSSLDAMSAKSVAAIGYARYRGGQAFAQSTYSCPRFKEASVFTTQDSCAWLKVAGSWLERDASGDDPGFDFDTVTTSIGGQRQIADGLFLGGALGWEENDLSDHAGRTSVDGDALLGAVSLKRVSGPWTLTGAVDLGFGSYDSRRQITVGGMTETAKASSDATNAGLHVRAAYQIPRDTWYTEPALDLDLSYVRLDGYTERGAGNFGLRVDDSDTVVFTGTPSLKLGRRVDFEDGRLLDAYVSAGVSLSAGEDFDTTARFLNAPAGAGSFTTTLDNPGVLGRLSAGLTYYATDRVQLRLQYDGSFADGQTTHGGELKLSYFF